MSNINVHRLNRIWLDIGSQRIRFTIEQMHHREVWQQCRLPYRRPGLSSRCSPCLELSAAARHVCTVSFHLPKPSEDSPLQPLLSSCQAREVISSLRPFLLLLLLPMRWYEWNYRSAGVDHGSTLPCQILPVSVPELTMGRGSNGSTDMDELHGSWISTCDPLTHEPLTGD